MILIQSAIFLKNYWGYYLEQSVNIKMIKRHVLMLILELCKLFSSSRHGLSMMIKSIWSGWLLIDQTVKKTERIKKKDWNHIKSTPMDPNEIVCNPWNPVETDIGIVIEIDLDLDLEIDIDYKISNDKENINIFIYISIYLYT